MGKVYLHNLAPHTTRVHGLFVTNYCDNKGVKVTNCICDDVSDSEDCESYHIRRERGKFTLHPCGCTMHASCFIRYNIKAMIDAHETDFCEHDSSDARIGYHCVMGQNGCSVCDEVIDQHRTSIDSVPDCIAPKDTWLCPLDDCPLRGLNMHEWDGDAPVKAVDTFSFFCRD